MLNGRASHMKFDGKFIEFSHRLESNKYNMKLHYKMTYVISQYRNLYFSGVFLSPVFICSSKF